MGPGTSKAFNRNCDTGWAIIRRLDLFTECRLRRCENGGQTGLVEQISDYYTAHCPRLTNW